MLVRRLPSCRAGITHVTALVRSTGVLDGHSGSRGFKSVLKRLRKQLGQHLLKNPDVVRRIVDSANIQPNEIVLEIGPGTGNMTVHMLQKARAVFAVELDERMFETVNTRVQHMGLLHKFFCVRSDFLKMDLPPGLDCCVANIPYQISSPVVEKLLAYRPLLKRAVIMFQLEFAERMMAVPGSSQYCRLSVNMKLLADVRPIMKVKRTQFRPPPKVDSMVVEIVPKEQTILQGDFKPWNTFLKLCFSGKNKTMRALFSLKNVVAKSSPMSSCVTVDEGIMHAEWKRRVHGILEELALSGKRANAMSLEEFIALYSRLQEAGAMFRDDSIEDSDRESEDSDGTSQNSQS